MKRHYKVVSTKSKWLSLESWFGMNTCARLCQCFDCLSYFTMSAKYASLLSTRPSLHILIKYFHALLHSLVWGKKRIFDFWFVKLQLLPAFILLGARYPRKVFFFCCFYCVSFSSLKAMQLRYQKGKFAIQYLMNVQLFLKGKITWWVKPSTFE